MSEDEPRRHALNVAEAYGELDGIEHDARASLNMFKLHLAEVETAIAEQRTLVVPAHAYAADLYLRLHIHTTSVDHKGLS